MKQALRRGGLGLRSLTVLNKACKEMTLEVHDGTVNPLEENY